jgi:hypothetical protein
MDEHPLIAIELTPRANKALFFNEYCIYIPFLAAESQCSPHKWEQRQFSQLPIRYAEKG